MKEREPDEIDAEPSAEGPGDPLTEGIDAVMDVVGHVVGSVDAALGAVFTPVPDEASERRRQELSSLFAGRDREQGRSR